MESNPQLYILCFDIPGQIGRQRLPHHVSKVLPAHCAHTWTEEVDIELVCDVKAGAMVFSEDLFFFETQHVHK